MKTKASRPKMIQTYRFASLKVMLLLCLVGLFTGCLKSLKPFYQLDQLVDSTPYYGVYERNGAWWVFLPFIGTNAHSEIDDGIIGASDLSLSIDISENSTEFDTAYKKLSLFTIMEDSLKAIQFYNTYLNQFNEPINEEIDEKENSSEFDEETFYITAPILHPMNY
jgi:hypothetical protein